MARESRYRAVERQAEELDMLIPRDLATTSDAESGARSQHSVVRRRRQAARRAPPSVGAT